MTMFDTVSAARAPGAGTAPAVPRPGTATTAPRPGARPRTVAVVGSGVAGLTAAYRLSRAGVEVELFEADDRLGGHAHTQEALDRDGRAVPLDTGFLVHNERTYPHLVSLFAELGVRTRDSEMSMSVRCDGCGLEYAGARGRRGCSPAPTSWSAAGTCACSPRCPGSTGSPAGCWPTRRPGSRACGSSSPQGGSGRTS